MAVIALINSMNPQATQTPVTDNFGFRSLIFTIDTANCSKIASETTCWYNHIAIWIRNKNKKMTGGLSEWPIKHVIPE